MSEFKCYQSADACSVVYTEPNVAGSSAVVHVSRVVGNPMARTLMRLCNAVLNDDLLEAQAELDSLGAMETL